MSGIWFRCHRLLLPANSFACRNRRCSWGVDRRRLEWRDGDIEEKFVKGGGPGGQKINKVRSKVVLRHLPTGLKVEVQQSRKLADNRGIARKLLRDKLDHLHHGEDSKMGRRVAKIQRQKSKRRKRARAKAATANAQARNTDEIEDK